MPSSVRIVTILALAATISQANAQSADCVQNCIDDNTSQSCRIADFPCICRQSSGNFLPNVITCMHDTCDNNLDSSVFLTPLSIICQLAGSPLPASAVSSALSAGSSLAAQPATVTATVTQGPGSSLNGGIVVPVSTTTIPGSYTTATLSGVTFTWGGPETSTIFGASPISTSMPGSSSSSSALTSSGGFVGLIPIVITTTNSAGSTYTSTISRPGAVSTYTTTDSRGATVVQTSTYTQSESSSGSQTTSLSRGSSSASSRSGSSTAAGGGAGSSSSRSSSNTGNTGMRTSTIFTPERTSAGGSSGTSTAGGSGSTDSAPFTNTNAGSTVKNGNWLGMSVLVASLGFLV